MMTTFCVMALVISVRSSDALPITGFVPRPPCAFGGILSGFVAGVVPQIHVVLRLTPTSSRETGQVTPSVQTAFACGCVVCPPYGTLNPMMSHTAKATTYHNFIDGSWVPSV